MSITILFSDLISPYISYIENICVRVTSVRPQGHAEIKNRIQLFDYFELLAHQLYAQENMENIMLNISYIQIVDNYNEHNYMKQI